LRRPLGISIIGGLLVSQLLTLYTTPVIYLAFDRLAQRFGTKPGHGPAEDHSPEAAIYEACLLRFRPITMTTLAALLGGLPLALGTGVGAELRRPLGIAIVGGLLLSQLLTLYTTPVVYLAFDRLAQRIARRRLPKPVDEQRALEAG